MVFSNNNLILLSFYVILDKKKLISGLPKPIKFNTTSRPNTIDKTESVAAVVSEVTQDKDLTFSEKKQFWESIESPKEPEPLANAFVEPKSITTTTVATEKRSNIPVPKARVPQIATVIQQTKNEDSSEASSVKEEQSKSEISSEQHVEYEESDSINLLTESSQIKEEIHAGDHEIQKVHSDDEEEAENVDQDNKRAQFFIGNKSEDIITKSSTERRTDFAFDNQGFRSTQDESSNLEEEICDMEKYSLSMDAPEKVHQSIEKSETETSEKTFEHREIFSQLTKEHLVENSFDSYEETKSTTTEHSFDFELPTANKETPLVAHSPIKEQPQSKVTIMNESLATDMTDLEIVDDVPTRVHPISHPKMELEGLSEISDTLSGKSPLDTLFLSSDIRPNQIDEFVVEQTLNEVKESIDAIQEGLIEVVKDGKLIKESPSEFEFKPLSQIKLAEPIIESYFEDTSTSHGDISLGEKIVEKVASQKMKTETSQEQEDVKDKAFVQVTDADIVSPDLTASPVPSLNDDSSNKQDSSQQKLRPSPKHPNTQRWSMNDPENVSGSDNSHHHSSFERSDSRPLSSDMENYLTSEYQTAADQISFKVGGSTTEYVTAVSTFDHSNNTISSHDSMKSFNSESSSQLGSIEVSEATETLIPSAMDADAEVSDLEEELDTKCGSLEDKGEAILLEYDATESSNLMKRSHEMTFQKAEDKKESGQVEEPAKVLSSSIDNSSWIDIDRPAMEASFDDQKIASSLEEGSILSVSLSSTSYEAETIVENCPVDLDMASLSGSLMGSYEDPSRFHDDVALAGHRENTEEPTTPTLDNYKIVSAAQSTIITTTETAQELGKRAKGHKRNESTSFSSFKGFEMSNQSSEDFDDLNDEMIIHENVPAVPIDIKLRLDEKRDSESDSDYDRYETEYSRSFKLPGESNKSKRQNEIKPELFDKDKDIRRSRSPSQSFIEPIMEDVNAEIELEEEHAVRKISQTPMDFSNVPDITITDDPQRYDSDEEPFIKPDYESKPTPLKESHITQQTEVVSSESTTAPSALKYAQEIEYKMTEEEYQETIAKKYEAQEHAHQTYKVADRDSPSGSDSFEMLDQPDLVDDFVVIEEVAKEADEYDTEGRSLRIQKTKIVKKHDEEVEKLIVKSAPADPNEGSMLYAATHDEMGFDFEESPPLDAAEGTSDQDADYNKRWIEMQRAVLEDIKEEDTDFEVGSSRISSFKDSFSSTPEYDIHKKLKQREQDAISINSLQEFENLEQAISLENRKYIQGSMDSLSNGSFPKKFIGRSLEGDGISLSSLREFEGLEDACLEAHLLEIRAKEEAALLLSRSDESNKSEDGKNVKVVKTEFTTNSGGGSTTTTTTTITRTVVGGDISDFKDMTFKAVTAKELERAIEHDDSLSNIMEASTDSLEGGMRQSLAKGLSGSRHDSADSLEINKSSLDIMTSSVDSIELGREGARSSRSDADSLELGQVPASQSIDSIDLEQQLTKRFDETQHYVTPGGETVVRTITTVTSSTVYPGMEKEISSDSLNMAEHRSMTSSESMDHTSSTATNATYKNATTDSQMSGSITSCDSTTMIDTLDTMVHSSGIADQFKTFRTSSRNTLISP